MKITPSISLIVVLALVVVALVIVLLPIIEGLYVELITGLAI